ncbi:cytochrome c biogenesis CcdA family protein [Phosphitispora fastidiosa]|uniref:cytochrome c biogenesis CcdA family protein n=1 Tax=Phosphitispora fastidiosa TaxID=2837202 RepID=UPI001E40BA83|nr:cytochrome c biogenesis protein CcdA [Phosphitispora fastidiosa]MBU7006457.1 cytochrome c-type biogenesis protein [Phosphitispora fastidiosa]
MFQDFFDKVVPQAVGAISPLSFLIVFFGGIITSISPCILTMIPVIVGYIGGYGGAEGKSRIRGFAMSAAFVLGMSVTFSAFGVAAVLLGRVVGQAGDIWYYVLAVIAIVMGLSLLGVINIRFPTLNKMPLKKGGLLPAFAIGLTFGLVASPCATPVLAVIITYVASTGSFYYGAGLLFAYGLGHGMPLLIAGTFTGVISRLPRFHKYSRYITMGSGVVLIVLGLYFLVLVRLY